MRRKSRRIATMVSGILRAASICTSAALLDATPTLAGAPEATVLTAGIPAEALAHALDAFARQTGLQLIYVSELVQEQVSNAVPAGLGAPDALARMIDSTGLKFEYLTPRSVRILSAPNAVTNISSAQYIKARIPLRPRVLTFILSYTF